MTFYATSRATTKNEKKLEGGKKAVGSGMNGPLFESEVREKSGKLGRGTSDPTKFQSKSPKTKERIENNPRKKGSAKLVHLLQ